MVMQEILSFCPNTSSRRHLIPIIRRNEVYITKGVMYCGRRIRLKFYVAIDLSSNQKINNVVILLS
jgi:hypothetical protein